MPFKNIQTWKPTRYATATQWATDYCNERTVILNQHPNVNTTSHSSMASCNFSANKAYLWNRSLKYKIKDNQNKDIQERTHTNTKEFKACKKANFVN